MKAQALEFRVEQARARKMGIVEPRPLKHRADKVRPCQMRSGEIGSSAPDRQPPACGEHADLARPQPLRERTEARELVTVQKPSGEELTGFAHLTRADCPGSRTVGSLVRAEGLHSARCGNRPRSRSSSAEC